MRGFWLVLLVLGQHSEAEELITCAKACDGCGSPFPFDEQEIYCEMCRECDTATFDAVITTTKLYISASVTTQRTESHPSLRNEETTTLHEKNYAANTAIRCDGNNTCFFHDKSKKRDIAIVCPEQVVPYCDEIEIERKESMLSTFVGGFRMRSLCPPILSCKERPITASTVTTTSKLSTRMSTPPLKKASTAKLPPSPLPPPIFLPPPILRFQMPPSNMPFQMPPGNMPFYQPPLPMMIQPPPFSYYPEQLPLAPSLYLPLLSSPQPRYTTKKVLVENHHHVKGLAQILSNPLGRPISEYLEQEENDLEMELSKKKTDDWLW